MEEIEEDVSAAGSYRHKRWIVRLLAVCTLISLILLISWTPEENRHLRSSAEADSLIHLALERQEIPPGRVQVRTVGIDSVLSRKAYTVDMPRGRSQTHLHYELDRLVRPYKIQTPARVRVPDREMQIHLIYGTNTIRTIRLRPDPRSADGAPPEP